jgi:hypothetical protein
MDQVERIMSTSIEAQRAVVRQFLRPTLLSICQFRGFNVSWLNNPPDSCNHGPESTFLDVCTLLKHIETEDHTCCDAFARVQRRIINLACDTGAYFHITDAEFQTRMGYILSDHTPMDAVKQHLAQQNLWPTLKRYMVVADSDSILAIANGLQSDIGPRTRKTMKKHGATLLLLDNLKESIHARAVAFAMVLHARLGTDSSARALDSNTVEMVLGFTRLVTPAQIVAPWTKKK